MVVLRSLYSVGSDTNINQLGNFHEFNNKMLISLHFLNIEFIEIVISITLNI